MVLLGEVMEGSLDCWLLRRQMLDMWLLNHFLPLLYLLSCLLLDFWTLVDK